MRSLKNLKIHDLKIVKITKLIQCFARFFEPLCRECTNLTSI